MRSPHWLALFAAACVGGTALDAAARSWEVRREVREGAREVSRERYEAARELRRCTTKECARREVREGYREVNRERREARREVKREVREDIRDQYWRSGRWYRDGRWWDRNDYYRRYYPHMYRNDDDDNLLQGLVIGAAVVGVTAAIVNAQDDE